MKNSIVIIITFIYSLALFAKSVDLTKISEVAGNDKKKVFVFLSATCPCSQKSISHLVDLSRQYKSVDFYAINETADLSQNDALKFFKEHRISFKILDDEKHKTADIFSALKTPHAYILNEKNEIIYEGGVANSTDLAEASEFYLANALKEASDNKPISKPNARALGCYIKRD